LLPNIQDEILKVTDGITLATGPAAYIKYETYRGLLILNELLYVIPLLTVLKIQTEENPNRALENIV
jgi:hypothetical protein